MRKKLIEAEKRKLEEGQDEGARIIKNYKKLSMDELYDNWDSGRTKGDTLVAQSDAKTFGNKPHKKHWSETFDDDLAKSMEKKSKSDSESEESEEKPAKKKKEKKEKKEKKSEEDSSK